MVFVFNAPVPTDGAACLIGTDFFGTGIKGNFVTSVPQTIPGASHESYSLNANDVRDSAVPCGFAECITSIEDLDDARFEAIALGIAGGLVTRQRRLRLCDLVDFAQQAGLIFLNLHKQMAFCLFRRPERFFGSAWHQA